EVLQLLQDYVAEESKTDNELFRKGVINYAMGFLLSSPSLLSNAYNQLGQLANKDWQETFPLLSNILYNAYVENYQPIPVDQVAGTIIGTLSAAPLSDNFKQQIVDGF